MEPMISVAQDQGRLTDRFDPRDAGRLAVLDTIRSSEGIARIDIAEATGVSPATVTSITADMLAAGLIEEILPEEKTAGSRRGRPRVLLKLRGAAHRIAGVKVTQKSVTVLVIDFEGHEIASREDPLATPRMTGQQLAATVAAAVDRTCADAGLTRRDLSAVGIGLAGQIDATRNHVYWSSSLSSRNVDLGPALAEVFPCPAFIDNDANLVAKAEHIFGMGRALTDFLVVTVEHGVGLGMMIGGKLYRGARGCGAEFGHTKVQAHGALCQCGQRGCLEAYVGDYALLREAHMSAADADHQDVTDLFAAARNGDPIATEVIDRAGNMFAMGLANLVNIFDPQLIILAGTEVAQRPMFEPWVIDKMKRLVIDVDVPLPDIKVNQWGNLMWAKGAAAYAMEQVTILTLRELGQNVA